MSHSISDVRRHPLAVCACVLLGLAAISPLAYSADKPKGQEISRAIAKEMTG
jgi:hypothetical protein